MNGSRFSWANFLFWFFQNGHFEGIQTATTGESFLIGRYLSWRERSHWSNACRGVASIVESSVIGWKFTTWWRERSRQLKYRPIRKLSPVVAVWIPSKWPFWKNQNKKLVQRKSWSVHNFAFKCPILKCSSCSQDQATSKTRFIWIELNQGKKFCDN